MNQPFRESRGEVRRFMERSNILPFSDRPFQIVPLSDTIAFRTYPSHAGSLIAPRR